MWSLHVLPMAISLLSCSSPASSHSPQTCMSGELKINFLQVCVSVKVPVIVTCSRMWNLFPSCPEGVVGSSGAAHGNY